MTATATLTSTPTTRPNQDEAEIRALISKWSRALEAKDVDALTADYVPDAVLFDVKPPYKNQGVAAVRRVWQDCLPYFPSSFTSILANIGNVTP